MPWKSSRISVNSPRENPSVLIIYIGHGDANDCTLCMLLFDFSQPVAAPALANMTSAQLVSESTLNAKERKTSSGMNSHKVEERMLQKPSFRGKGPSGKGASIQQVATALYCGTPPWSSTFHVDSLEGELVHSHGHNPRWGEPTRPCWQKSRRLGSRRTRLSLFLTNKQ